MENKKIIGVIDNKILEKAKTGNDQALEAVFSKFRDVISKIAHNYYIIGAERDDLIQEGMIGLFKAIRDYDCNCGISFESFASGCIRRNILTALKNANRKKHTPLNLSLSLNAEQYEGEEKELIDLLENGDIQNPEEIVIKNETYSHFNKLLYASLSKLEFEILTLQTQGFSYKEISDITGKSLKSIDNAVQRVNKKINIIKQQNMSQ